MDMFLLCFMYIVVLSVNCTSIVSAKFSASISFNLTFLHSPCSPLRILFLIYFIDYAITIVPIFPLLSPSAWYHLPSSNPRPLSSCPWVMHKSSLASPFPIFFLISPCLFCTYQLCFLFPLPFPPFSLLLLPADNPPCDLYFCDSVPVLIVCLVCFSFCFCFTFSRWWLWVCYHFTVHGFDLLFLR